ncbi:DUF6119 family protein [Moheibacter lacus]|uniref:TIGR04141 family sporadically distributed protein n=1 Tax=Moheibacter lacus TaxID=2745851 RepID=A0A838ZTM4_9FLAO|nr:DUF6119 family protein [Moheibacter lacus]MBA5630340.1 TIGR04141 family sporadically distributed protein [Moheibacter lacus]
MSEKIQNNIYLIKDKLKDRNTKTRKISTKTIDLKYLSTFLKSKKFREQKVKGNLSEKYEIRLFYKQSVRDIKWKEFINSVALEGEDILNLNKSKSESYIILFQNISTKKIYASTGGYAHITVQEIATNDFGIEILSKIVKSEDKALKSTKERNLTGGIQGEIKFFRNDYNLYENENFGKIYNELNASLNKDILTKAFGFKPSEIDANSLCIAKNSFSIKKSISFSQLLNVIEKCESLLKKKGIEINSVEKIGRSEDLLKETLINEVLQNIFQNYLDENKHFSVEISNRDFEKYFQATSSTLTFTYDKRSNSFNIDDVIRNIETIIKQLKIEIEEELDYEPFKKVIKNTYLETFDEDGNTLTRDKLINHFCAEIIHEGNTYFLIEKDWYVVKESFIKKINEQTQFFLSENKYSGKKMLKWNGGEENDYNASYLGKDNMYVFDRFTSLNIEACDILNVEKDTLYFYHVKKGFDNSMRDLCNQVYIAGRKIHEDVKSNYEFLESLYDSVANSKGKSPYTIRAKKQFDKLSKKQFIAKIKNKKVVIVLAVADSSKKKRDLFTNIEKFESNIAKFMLTELAKNMRNLGIEFQITQIDK